MIILITGANGFIGTALRSRLSPDSGVVGVDIAKRPDKSANIVWEQADLTDGDSVTAICAKHSPDVVIHCAGIAHQKIGVVDSATYMRVNSEATENLAKAAADINPDVCFIFLSSVSVYGEGPHPRGIRSDKLNATCCDSVNLTRQAVTSEFHGAGINPHPRGIAFGFHRTGITQISQIKQTKINNGVGEDSECRPSSDYAVSKLDAERRLIALFDGGVIHNLIILRLAPVYDRDWSFNLDRRVLAPLNMAYIRFGSGLQRMSALARPNLIDFIDFLVRRLRRFSQIKTENNIKNVRARQNNMCNQRNLRIFNVSDAKVYEFSKIIQVFKKSGIRPNRPIISVPLFPVWIATRIAGIFLPGKRNWLHSCYDKLASDLVFDNGKMMRTGFRPVHSLETIFDPQITQINAD
jgi:nucleoside-diphosphate-sugar epimerase